MSGEFDRMFQGMVRVAFGLAVACLVAGCDGGESGDAEPGGPAGPEPRSDEWFSFGGDLKHTRANETENQLTVETVKDLGKLYTAEDTGSTSTPAVVDGVAYWGGAHGKLHATNVADGTELWVEELANGFFASPMVHDGLVYLGDSEGTVHAVDSKTGDPEWSTNVANYDPDEVTLAGAPFTIHTVLFGSPARAGDLLVIGTASAPFAQSQKFRGNIVGLDLKSGAERWRFDVTRDADAEYGVGVSVWSSPAVDEESKTILVGTGQSYAEPASPMSDSLLAIDYETGDLRWHKQFTPDDFYTFELLVSGMMQGDDYDVGAAPNLFEIDGRKLVGVGDKSGMYYVLDRETGELVWGKELSPGSPLGGVMTAGAVNDGVVYVGSNEWTFLGTNLSLTDIPFSDARNKCHLVALDAGDGTELWRATFDSVCIGGVSYAAGVAYIGVTNGTVHAVDAKTGEELWSHEASPDGIASGASISGGKLFATHGWAFAIGVSYPTDLEGGLTVYGLPD